MRYKEVKDRDMTFLPSPGRPCHSQRCVCILICLCASGGVVNTESVRDSLAYSYDPLVAMGNGPASD